MKLDNLGDSFGWAFRDPAWFGKVLVQGLITYVPIVGWIAMNGWLMLAFENARAGRTELPPAGFHLRRGIGFWLVQVIYGLVLNIPTVILYVFFGIATGHGNGALANSLSGFALLWNFLASLFFKFLMPSLIVHISRDGFAGGMNVPSVWSLASRNAANSVFAAIVIFVASVIGGFGVACFIGMIFTIPYENTITAGAAAWFEKTEGANA